MKLVASNPGELLPDLPGKVHGFKNDTPWTVQCDDCLTCWSGDVLIFVAKSAFFNQHVPGVRLCEECWAARGWVQDYFGFHLREVPDASSSS